MNKLKFTFMALAMTALQPTFAGGLLTNTNQNIAFNRNFARDGVIGIDGVYSNPAGVAFLSKGFHLSLNIQNIYQTRTIESGMSVPLLQGTPFYQPLKLNGGNENGIKQFKGRASVPILPSFHAALNYDHWGFQVGFGLTGGGGKATFNEGLGSFERAVSMIPALLYSQGITATGYGVKSYINGQQYTFGTQFGATYKFNKRVAVYGGARFNYIWNKYEGNITNISASINGTSENLYNYFDAQANTYAQMAFFYKMRPARWHRTPPHRHSMRLRPHSIRPGPTSSTRPSSSLPTNISTARRRDGASRQSSASTTRATVGTSARDWSSPHTSTWRTIPSATTPVSLKMGSTRPTTCRAC
jgi:hypothetical protein